jgi:hypothetical protein
MVKISLREAKELVALWSKGTFPSRAESIRYHFARHGREVSSTDVWQYLRKAEAFGRKLRGAKVNVLGDNATRYTKNRYYVIKDQAGKILSFGLESGL